MVAPSSADAGSLARVQAMTNPSSLSVSCFRPRRSGAASPPRLSKVKTSAGLILCTLHRSDDVHQNHRMRALRASVRSISDSKGRTWGSLIADLSTLDDHLHRFAAGLLAPCKSCSRSSAEALFDRRLRCTPFLESPDRPLEDVKRGWSTFFGLSPARRIATLTLLKRLATGGCRGRCAYS